jgi:hypothetical protein
MYLTSIAGPLVTYTAEYVTNRLRGATPSKDVTQLITNSMTRERLSPEL